MLWLVQYSDLAQKQHPLKKCVEWFKVTITQLQCKILEQKLMKHHNSVSLSNDFVTDISSEWNYFLSKLQMHFRNRSPSWPTVQTDAELKSSFPDSIADTFWLYMNLSPILPLGAKSIYLCHHGLKDKTKQREQLSLSRIHAKNKQTNKKTI